MPSAASNLSPALARTLDPVIEAVWSRFDRQQAMDHVRYISQFWRVGGNPGYDQSLDRIHTRLVASGFGEMTPGVSSSTWFEEYPNQGNGWSYSAGTLAIARAGQADQVVLSREKQQIALCINSFSTADGGVVRPLVDVGRGDQEADYAGGRERRGCARRCRPRRVLAARGCRSWRRGHRLDGARRLHLT
jgi:hypothetical protein